MTVVLASLLTGLFTLAAGLSTLFLQGRQQRVAAQDERLWTRRAETYVALLQYQGLGVVGIQRGTFRPGVGCRGRADGEGVGVRVRRSA